MAAYLYFFLVALLAVCGIAAPAFEKRGIQVLCVVRKGSELTLFGRH
jgi:hypothetical protein